MCQTNLESFFKYDKMFLIWKVKLKKEKKYVIESGKPEYQLTFHKKI
jgi:hypothetical protein